MFTGLIEEVGTIERIKQQGALTMTIRCKKVLEDVKVGDSIAVDGTCLTVTSFTSQSFDVDVIIGTSDRTKFKSVSAGYPVNLERALLPTTRLGGHFVSGHVDKTAKVLRKLSKGNAVVYHISLDKNDQKYVIPKGSIAVDGTSLTLFELNAHYFEIQLIPETQQATKLMTLKPGDTVHLEFDMLGKYIVRQEALACSAQ
ncbi:riboflavin synthase [Macrococcus bovicus]|uniref:Riboflavin synthase n=1 Tax=Macrococcus bovicus TaxID=69968 RepID=A0A4R6C0C1_9STAP|nr:riboflavin synthase [Macrococcus bovicus]TDM14439.1 riboflavin synthase [Macrococcus bovicus]